MLGALAEAAPQEEEEKEGEARKDDSDWLQVAHLKRSRQLQRLQLSKGGSLPQLNVPVEEEEDADADADANIDAGEDEDPGSPSPMSADALASISHHLRVGSGDRFTGVQSLPNSPAVPRKTLTRTASRTCLRRSGSRSDSNLHRHVRFAESPSFKEI